jgi:hypothetical protein
MNRHSSTSISPEPGFSLYGNTFRISSENKYRESAASTKCISSKKSLPSFGLKSKNPPSISLMKAFQQIRGSRCRRQSSLPSIETEHTASSEQLPTKTNVMEFLIDICPEDVLPKILAFAGPQKTAALSKVNRVWRDVIAEEWTWRVLCEDLYKVRSYPFLVSHLPGSSKLYSHSTPLSLYHLLLTVDTRSARTCILERLLHEESDCAHRLSIDSCSTSHCGQWL